MQPKVLIIPLQSYPIPAIKGGSVENIVTHLINENDINKNVFFYVISKYDKDAKKHKYKYTKIFYINNNLFDYICYLFIKITRKLIFNRYTRRIIKSMYGFRELTYFGYKCDRIAKRVKPDKIVVETYHLIHRLWPLSKHFGSKNIYYHLHNTKEDLLGSRLLFPNTIAVSRYVLELWAKDKTIQGINIVLHNGIDIDRFGSSINDYEKKSLRKSLGINDNSFVIIFTGRLRPHKGLLELLTAFDKINGLDIMLLIIGAFISESQEYKIDESAFEHKCLSIINNNKKIIRLKKVKYEEIHKYYAISNIQCIPSICEEGAGLVAIEGMASGLPLIITNSGGMPEYTGNKCAIIINRSNIVDEIYGAIIALYRNSDLRNKMSNLAKERAAKFSQKNYYSNFINIIFGNTDYQNK